jgi:hypothetical protein
LVHGWTTGQTRTHKTHHGPNLGEATTFPFIIYFVPSHETSTQMPFCPRTPKWESRNSQSWDSYDFGGPNFLCRPSIELKQSCIPCRELSNCMWHIACTQENRGDSRLLMVESQIGNLTPNTSFSHNLCFKCPNGSCQPILDIYVPKYFQWYKKFFDPMSCDPYNYFLKNQKSIGLQLSKWELT